ncbi:MAG TPA: glycoside hydrolase family 71/99-like protein [Mucilaginibacter sp.]
MYKRLTVTLITFFILTACGKSSSQPTPPPVTQVTPPDTTTIVSTAKPVAKTNSQKVYVHYMPWFETPQTSDNGTWGQHWTMATQNPDIIQSNGQRQIASYFYPLIGPYASSDRDVIDYRLLLMKYSGIDGVIVDWYGVHNVNDYPLNKRNTDSLFNRIPATGLQFAICYEDTQLAQVKAKAGIDTVTAAKEDFAYLQSAYFRSKSYVAINKRPLLLCFGPQGMNTPADWQQAFIGLNTQPLFLPLQDHAKLAGNLANGEFVWVQSNNIANLTNFYSSHSPSSIYFAGAYPGFKDFYKPGGWGNTLFVIDHNGTAALQASLNAAKTSGTNYLQLITWNDYGEGTMFEPTTEFNFTLLQTIQRYTGVTYTDAELKLIYKWYTLRKKYKTDAAITKQLTNAYNYLVALNVADAKVIIDNLN